MRQHDISAIKLGTTSITKVYVGQSVIWPMDIVYTLSNVHMVYSGGLSYLHANSDIYNAHIEGTLTASRGGTVIETTTVTLTPSNYWSVAEIVISGTNILWNKAIYGTTYKAATTRSIRGTYSVGGSTFTEDLNINLGENIASEPSYSAWTYGQWEYQRTQEETKNYVASISSSMFTSPSSPAPFGGGSYTILTCASSHQERDNDYYRRTKQRTLTYTWTSGSTSQDTESGYDYKWEYGTWTTVTDTPYLTKSQSWIDIYSNSTVVFSYNTSSARSVTITNTNGTASNSVTLYQSQYYAAYITPSPASITPVATGGTFNISIAYGYTEYRVTSNQSWVDITAGETGGSASSADTEICTIQVSENTAYSSRSAVLTIESTTSGVSITQTISITQAARASSIQIWRRVNGTLTENLTGTTVTATLGSAIQLAIVNPASETFTVSFPSVAGWTMNKSGDYYNIIKISPTATQTAFQVIVGGTPRATVQFV